MENIGLRHAFFNLENKLHERSSTSRSSEPEAESSSKCSKSCSSRRIVCSTLEIQGSPSEVTPNNLCDLLAVWVTFDSRVRCAKQPSRRARHWRRKSSVNGGEGTLWIYEFSCHDRLPIKGGVYIQDRSGSLEISSLRRKYRER